MASTIYLIRKNQQWARYDGVVDLSVTGAASYYSGVTGDNTNEEVTIPGASLIDGMTVIFASITGGNGLQAARLYYVRDAAGGETCKLADTLGGDVIDFTSNITAGEVVVQSDEIRIWSAEYRNIHDSTSASSATAWSNISVTDLSTVDFSTVGGTAAGIARISDEVRKVPLRQSLLMKTHWKIDRGSDAAPRYLFAEWASGDIWADNAPETDDD